jgi:thermitase
MLKLQLPQPKAIIAATLIFALVLAAMFITNGFGMRRGGDGGAVLGANTSATPSFVSKPSATKAPAQTFLVSLKPAQTSATLQRLKAAGAKIKKHNKKLNFAVVSYAGSFKQKFADLQASPDYYLAVAAAPNDPRFGEQWGLEAIKVSEIWTQPEITDSENRKVAVIDSGVCAAHPDLQGRLTVGWDFVQNDNTPQDEFGHGCAVAGIIAANVDNALGIAGVTKNVKIMPLRVLDANGVGTYSQLAEAIVYAADKGAQVINLSLGGSEASSVLKSAVDYAVSKGVKVVAAAGNTGSAQVLYPAKYENVIAVGAVTEKNADGKYPVVGFSSTGSEIDVWAPGQNILSLSTDGEYKAVNGTSFATPLVSGLVALGVEIDILPFEISSVNNTSSSGPIVAQGYDPGYLYNASNQDLLIVDDDTLQEVKPGAWYIRVGGTTAADDADAIWAKCSPGDYHCGSVKDSGGNAISGYRLFKLSGLPSNTTYRVYNYDWNNDSKLALNENKGGAIGAGWVSGYDADLGPTPPNFKEYYLKTCGRLTSESGETCPIELPHTCDRLNGTGVVIYTESNCLNSSDKETFTQNNQAIDLEADPVLQRFKNNISSIKVTKDWSIKVFTKYLDEKEPWSCINGSRWDLNKDKFAYNNPNGITMGGKISSFIVYNDATCGNSLAYYCPATGATGLSAQSCEVPTSPPPTNFCSTITWGGSGNYCRGDQLVTCSSTKTVTNVQECRYGCQVNPLYKSDVCKSGDGEPNLSTESVKFYGDSEFNAASLRLTLGAVKSDEPTAGTLYKSIKIPAGWSVKAYSQNGQQGEQICWNVEQPLLESTGWHAKIESVEISDTDLCPVQAPEPPYWTANYYSGDSKWWDRDIPSSTATCKDRIVGETLVKDFGDTTPCGGGHSSNNWVGEYIATRNFPDGDYVLHINHDDGVQVFIDGKQKVIRSSMGSGPVCEPFHFNGNVEFRVLHREESGDAKIDFTWNTDTSVCNDITPPKGTMVLPEKNTYTNSATPVLVKALASDVTETEQNTSGVSKVEFYAKSNNWNGNQLTLIGTATTNPYEFSWATVGLPEGIYFLTAKVYDTQGNDSGFLGDESFWTYVTIDRSKPQASLLPISDVGSAYQFNVGWEGSDNLSLKTELNYDVQYQLNCTGSWLEWVGFRSGTTKTFTGVPGASYCFRVRAIDLANNVGNWSTATTSIALAACDVNQYLAEYFDNSDLSGEPVMTVCENAIDHDWGTGGPNLASESTIYGDGGDGAIVIATSTTDSPVDASANAQAGTNQIKAANANFRAGQRIIVYQVKGTNAGTYQITKIKAYDAATGTITTSSTLKTTYTSDSNSAAQVIVVKQYTNVTVAPGAVWKAKEWNGKTGGILVFLANGKVQIDGTLDATGTGFRGGRSGANPNPFADNTVGEQGEGAGGASTRSTSSNANGGGAGAPRDHNGEGNGGGGGGYGSNGSVGGKHISTSGVAGAGGSTIGSPDLSQIFFGGAGGGGGFGDAEKIPVEESGTGGDGGGAIFIRSKQIVVTGQIFANGVKGQAGTHDIGAGGAGAGGSVYLRGEEVNFGPDRIKALGVSETPGGTSGGGGQSGVGRIRVEYLSFVNGTAVPAASVAQVSTALSDNFSVRWTGTFNFAPNRYKFHSFADDGMRVWVDGTQIINDWADGFTETLATSYVGEVLNLKVEYYEHGGNALARLNIIPGSNKPPVINPVPEQITSESKPFADIDLNDYGFDPDFNYSVWSVQNGTNVQLAVTNGIAKVTKAPGWIGSETLTVRLTDEWGEYVTTQIKFTVVPNTPPQFNPIADQTTTEDTPFAELDLQSYVVDPDLNDVHTFKVSTTTNLLVEITTGKAKISPKADWFGEQTLMFTVTDRNGETATTSVKFIVTPVNDAPLLKSSPDTDALEDAVYTYQVVTEDVDNATLTYTLMTAPAGVQMSAGGKITWTPRQADVGVHPIKLTVSDGEFTLEQSYDLTVINVNDAPVITSAPVKNAVDGQAYSYNVNATDEDGDTLTYSLTQKPTGMSIDSATGVISWTPGTTAVGEHTITVKVSDGQASDTQTYTLTVIAKFTIGSSLITRERGGVENKQVNPGETINFILKIDNNTLDSIKLLKITLESNSPYVKITDKNELIQNIAAGTTAQTQGELMFTVDKDAPVGTVLVFKVIFENNQTKEVYEQEVKFTVK